MGVPEDVAPAARWLLVLLGLNLAVGLPLGVYDSVLYSLGRFPLRTAVQLTILAVRTAAFLWILHGGGGLIEIGLAITFCGVLQNVILLSIVHWLLPNLRFSIRFIDRSTYRMIRSYSMWAFLAMIAQRVSFSTDAIVISAFLTPEYITYFAIAARLVEYGKNAVQSGTAVLTPTISTLEAGRLRGNSPRAHQWITLRCMVHTPCPARFGIFWLHLLVHVDGRSNCCGILYSATGPVPYADTRYVTIYFGATFLWNGQAPLVCMGNHRRGTCQFSDQPGARSTIWNRRGRDWYCDSQRGVQYRAHGLRVQSR